MMTIANLDTIWVTANVPEKDTSFVSKDQPVSVTFPAYPGKVFEGRCCSSPMCSSRTRGVPRSASPSPIPTAASSPACSPMSVSMRRTMSRLVVPTSALLMSNDRTSVFAEVEPWTFDRRDVVTEYEEGNAAVIKSGLNPANASS